MSSKKIYMVRHGQGEHNEKMDPNIPDPLLTDRGRDEARALGEKTAETFQLSAQLLVTSPLRRCLETTVVAFPGLVNRLISQNSGSEGVLTDSVQETESADHGGECQNKAIVLDILQESGADPSSTPTAPVEDLRYGQGGIYAQLNYDTLSPGYASKEGIFAPSARKVRERAKMVREWLRERPEDEIVVVSHGGIMHSIVDRGEQDTEWGNGQVRVFTFDTSNPKETDPDMVEIKTEAAGGVEGLISSGSTAASALRVDQLPGAIGTVADE